MRPRIEMVRYRVLRRPDVPEVQAVALKAWMAAYRKTVPLPMIRRFVSQRYSTNSFENLVFPSIRRGQSQFYLAIENERIIGYSNAGKGEWGWELYRIYLLPEYIGRGIGKKLLQLAEDFLRKKRAKKYHLYAYVKNKPAIEFYYRNSFERLKEKDKPPEICMEKKLTRRAPSMKTSVSTLDQSDGPSRAERSKRSLKT